MIVTFGGIRQVSGMESAPDGIENTGKTTFVTNLAAYQASLGKRVMILDMALNGPAMEWVNARYSKGTGIGKPSKGCQKIDVITPGEDIESVLKLLSREYDHVIINAGNNQASEKYRCAWRMSHKFYMPAHLKQGDEEHESFFKMQRSVRTLTYIYRYEIGSGECYVCFNRSLYPTDSREFGHASLHIPGSLFGKSLAMREDPAFEVSRQTGLGVHELPSSDYSRDAAIDLEELNHHVFKNEYYYPAW